MPDIQFSEDLANKTTPVSGDLLLGADSANSFNLVNIDVSKLPVSTYTATALGLKVDKTTTINGKALSSNVTLTTDDVTEGTNQYDKVVAILSGSGISVTGTYPNFTVTNSSPDQVVSLTEGENITITGTYPNFTIESVGGSGTPATSVVNETTFGISPAIGIGVNYARQDHTHGTPAFPTSPTFTELQLDTMPALTAYSKGKTFWNTERDTLSTDIGGGVSLDHGQELYTHCKNNTGVTILNGQTVYINGVDSGNSHPTIALADASNITSSYSIGIATQDILDGTTGFITRFGSVHDLNTSTYTAGDIIYQSAAVPGAYTKIAPTTPNISIKLGTIGVVSATVGSILVDIGVPHLTDVNLLNAGDGTASSAMATKMYNDQRWIDINRYGLVNGQTNLTFDGVNTVTVTPISTQWVYYRAGTRCIITGAKSVVLPGTPVTTGTYFIYIDSTDGTLIQSTTPWTLQDTKVLVAIVTFNNALTPKYIFADERHPCDIDRKQHFYDHKTRGTQYSSGGALTGYTLNTSTAVGNTFGIDIANIFDENLYFTLNPLVDTNGTTANYLIAYRPAIGSWNWTFSDMPFQYTPQGGTAPYTYLQYDLNGVMTASINNRWVNYYVVMTNGRDGTEAVNNTSTSPSRFMLVPGRGSYSTNALAYAEDFSTFAITSFPASEVTAVWKITYNTSGVANTVKGRCRIDRVNRVNANISTSTASVTASHDGLAGVNLAQATVQYGHIDDQTQTIAGAKTFSDAVTVPYVAYGAGWNGDLTAPTKDAVYDKIETLAGGTLTGIVNFTEGVSIATPNATIPVDFLKANNAATNVDISIVPKGTGAFMLAVPDNTATGGNKRGVNAIDLQTLRSVATQVANGSQSTLLGAYNTASGVQSTALGISNTASGAQSTAVGFNNTASASFSTAVGFNNTASAIYTNAIGCFNTASTGYSTALGIANEASGVNSTSIGYSNLTNSKLKSFAKGYYSRAENEGDEVYNISGASTQPNIAKYVDNGYYKVTANATPVEALLINGTTSYLIAASSLVNFKLTCCAYTSTFLAKTWEINGTIKRNSTNTTSIVGTVTKSVKAMDTGMEAIDITITADDTNDALKVMVTGDSTLATRFAIKIESTEVKF